MRMGLVAGETFEIFGDCVDDLQGVVNLAKDRGVKEIYIVGHSTGSQKNVYYLPKEASKDKKEGIVEDVGHDKDGKPLPLKKGDKVLYGGYSSEEFEINGQTLLIIDFKDILARFE
jgi:chaperonin GroES